LPGGLDFNKRVHRFLAEEEEGSLGQLVTEKRVNRVKDTPRSAQACMHQHWR
jgi:hypothetical protein